MPRKVTFRAWIGELHWGVKAATSGLVFLGALGGAAVTWEKFGWWKPASVQYVNEKINPIDRRSLDAQIELAEGKRDATEESIFKWEDKMKETTDIERIRDYRERVRALQQTKAKQDAQIQTLQRLRGF